jgi:hypothetical protein
MNKASLKIRKSKLKKELANRHKIYRAISKRTASRVLEMTSIYNLLTIVIPVPNLEVRSETIKLLKLQSLYFIVINSNLIQTLSKSKSS